MPPPAGVLASDIPGPPPTPPPPGLLNPADPPPAPAVAPCSGSSDAAPPPDFSVPPAEWPRGQSWQMHSTSDDGTWGKIDYNPEGNLHWDARRRPADPNWEAMTAEPSTTWGKGSSNTSTHWRDYQGSSSSRSRQEKWAIHTPAQPEKRLRDVCRHWEVGRCDAGDNCNFKHPDGNGYDWREGRKEWKPTQ